MGKRRPIIDPNPEALLSLLDHDPALSIVLRGHLLVEALLVRIRKAAGMANPEGGDFPTKARSCATEGLLSPAQAEALCELNDLRNDYGHILGYELTRDRAARLAYNLHCAGFDWSDDAPIQGESLLFEWYGGTSHVVYGCINAINSVLGLVLLDLGDEIAVG